MESFGEREPSQWLRDLWARYGMTHVPFRVMTVAKMLDRITGATIQQEAGLSLAQWRVMANLMALGETTAKSLSERAHVDPAEVSRAISSLEKLGYLSRRMHPDSKAKRLVSLTTEGLALTERLAAGRRAAYANLLGALSEEELEAFNNSLFKLATRIEGESDKL